MMSVNDTPTLPIAIQLGDFNTGYYDTTDLKEIPALISLINFTLFKYSEFDDYSINDVDYFVINYDFKCNHDTWCIDGNEFRYHRMSEISFDDFRKLNSLNLLSLVNPFNYEGKYLTHSGIYKFEDYMDSLSHSMKCQLVKDFKKIAFDLNHKSKMIEPFEQHVGELIATYNFGQKLEHVETVNSDSKSRSYNSFTLESSFSGDDVQLVFSNYTSQVIGQTYCSIEPLYFEILLNGDPINCKELAKFNEHYGYMIDMIKTDLYKNTFN